ncbi:MAG: alpha-L-rhamnosidase N-terminal domain-containing protein, partial [Eubacteriales bacterium]|nr:alpha-L-rhamnosidase N-terminal domain-containing protein [Eubacteriales bacterium]
MNNTLWKQWITNHTRTPFYARKEFDVKSEVQKAVVKICGLGQFELHLNGQKVGDHELDPAWTEYRKLVQYVTFDVTDALHEGRNVIGAEVGNGWFHLDDSEGYSFKFPEFMPPNPNPYRVYGEHLVLGLVLEITYLNGTSERIETDTTWKTISHEVVSSNVYGSELIEQRLNQGKWDSFGFDDSAWNQAEAASGADIPEGKLLEQKMPPIKVIHSYEAKFCGNFSESTDAEIYDLSQNCSFMLSFEVKGRKGDVVKFYPAEKLDSRGDVDQFAKGWTMVNNCITF